MLSRTYAGQLSPASFSDIEPFLNTMPNDHTKERVLNWLNEMDIGAGICSPSPALPNALDALTMAEALSPPWSPLEWKLFPLEHPVRRPPRIYTVLWRASKHDPVTMSTWYYQNGPNVNLPTPEGVVIHKASPGTPNFHSSWVANNIFSTSTRLRLVQKELLKRQRYGQDTPRFTHGEPTRLQLESRPHSFKP